MARLVHNHRKALSNPVAEACVMLSRSVNGLAETQAEGCERQLEIHFRNRILAALEAAGYLELRSVRCHVSETIVVLHGVLPSYHLKQVAQQAILALNDQRVVKNLIDVSSDTRGNSPAVVSPAVVANSVFHKT